MYTAEESMNLFYIININYDYFYIIMYSEDGLPFSQGNKILISKSVFFKDKLILVYCKKLLKSIWDVVYNC